MAARRVYRAIEDNIELGRFSDLVLPHTALCRELRYALREHRDFGKIYLTRCLSTASFTNMASDPAASYKSWQLDLEHMIETVPYLNIHKKKSETVESARESAVKKFLELSKQISK